MVNSLNNYLFDAFKNLALGTNLTVAFVYCIFIRTTYHLGTKCFLLLEQGKSKTEARRNNAQYFISVLFHADILHTIVKQHLM